MIRLLLWVLAGIIIVNLIRLLQVGVKIRRAKREEEAPEIPPFDSIQDAEFEDLGSSENPPKPPEK